MSGPWRGCLGECGCDGGRCGGGPGEVGGQGDGGCAGDGAGWDGGRGWGERAAVQPQQNKPQQVAGDCNQDQQGQQISCACAL